MYVIYLEFTHTLCTGFPLLLLILILVLFSDCQVMCATQIHNIVYIIMYYTVDVDGSIHACVMSHSIGLYF